MPEEQEFETWDDISLKDLLLGLGEDLDREGLQRTPHRVMKAWTEFLGGYQLEPEDFLDRTFEAEESSLQVCKNIEFTSMCEHHLLAFTGVCHIGYVPTKRVVGLSKLARLVDCYAQRLQIQERMVAQIADALVRALEPEGVLVVATAKHLCCHGRGVRRSQMEFTTSATRGKISSEAFALLLGS